MAGTGGRAAQPLVRCGALQRFSSSSPTQLPGPCGHANKRRNTAVACRKVWRGAFHAGVARRAQAGAGVGRLQLGQALTPDTTPRTGPLAGTHPTALESGMEEGHNMLTLPLKRGQQRSSRQAVAGVGACAPAR